MKKYIIYPLLTFIVFSILCVSLETTAIAKKRSVKKDTATVQTDASYGATSTTETKSSDDTGVLFGMGFFSVVLFLFLLPSLIPALIASSKGRSGLGIFLLSVFFTPIIGLIVALLLSSNKKQTKE